jgi:plasmid stabilization system protein ParE
MTVRFTATAEQDMVETLNFYRAPSAMGDAFNAAVLGAVSHLKDWPYSGHRRRDLTKEDVCFWHESNFLFVFQLQNDTVYIVAVLHASRHVAKILHKRFKQIQSSR